jgi:hypothetical protein
MQRWPAQQLNQQQKDPCIPPSSPSVPVMVMEMLSSRAISAEAAARPSGVHGSLICSSSSSSDPLQRRLHATGTTAAALQHPLLLWPHTRTLLVSP